MDGNTDITGDASSAQTSTRNTITSEEILKLEKEIENSLRILISNFKKFNSKVEKYQSVGQALNSEIKVSYDLITLGNPNP
jgi:hypothetical protein